LRHSLELAILENERTSGTPGEQSASSEAPADLSTLRSQFLKVMNTPPPHLIANDPAATEFLLPAGKELLLNIQSEDIADAKPYLGQIVRALSKINLRLLDQARKEPTEALIAHYFATSHRMRDALRSGDIATAESLAPEVLVSNRELTPRGNGDFDWDDVYAAYDALGRAALLRGDYEGAKQYLLEASKVKGSPALSTFGPNLWLARSLLDHGETGTVVQFLMACKAFWTRPVRDRLDTWISEIQQGKMPTLSPNSSPEW
jgi:hypothetical protein